MRKIIDIVFLILYLQTGWLSIYAIDYISSDNHCIIFHMKLCNCILFPITWNATEVYSYTFLLRIYSLVYDIETMVIYQKYKLTRYYVKNINFCLFNQIYNKWWIIQYIANLSNTTAIVQETHPFWYKQFLTYII